jgi:hypothetical protein
MSPPSERRLDSSAPAAIESRRLTLQAELDARKAAGDRNRLGQFATPPALARAVVGAALAALPAGAPIRFLDPAFGTGAFLSALLELAPTERLAALAGVEIDPHYGEPAHALWQGCGPARAFALTLDDFTRMPAPAPAARPTLIVCNPPYVRHQHLSRDDKARLQALGEQTTGLRLSGLAGLYAHFMLAAHAWAADNAVAAWLVPSEFMDVGYGAALRRYLTEQVTLLGLHRFEPGDVQFGDALVSSAVVWWRHAPPPAEHTARFSRGGDLTAPARIETLALAELARCPKWTRFAGTPPHPFTHAPSRDRGRDSAGTGDRDGDSAPTTLGDLFTIRRGIATGDNRFFILSPEQVAAHGLPAACLKPILPGPRHLPPGLTEITADPTGAPRLARPRFLLDCRLPESELAERWPALARYLAQGAATVAQGYLCRHRRPWYAQEHRQPPPLLCTYMGRVSATGGAPFRFIRNHSQAVAPNTYLLLYPTPALAPALAATPERLDALWRGLNRLDGARLIAEGRVYGGGLHKLEPRELARLPVADLLSET